MRRGKGSAAREGGKSRGGTVLQSDGGDLGVQEVREHRDDRVTLFHSRFNANLSNDMTP